ncbi:hypothetical protein P0L94_16450 [Microbacter sp. GSS18]|nr:hypothetical protein P0L94_16450 [Microbacter sp. GSS18]
MTERRRTPPAVRRVGYVIAVVVNLVLLWLVLVWPGWDAIPYVTVEAAAVIPLVVASLILGAVVNTLNAVLDSRALHAVGDIATSILSFVVVWRVWDVFPFAFPAESGAESGVRILLGVLMGLIVLGIVGNVAVLIRLGVGQSARRL